MLLRRQNTNTSEVSTVGVDVLEFELGSVGSFSPQSLRMARDTRNDRQAYSFDFRNDDKVALPIIAVGNENPAMATAVAISLPYQDFKAKGVEEGLKVSKGTSGATPNESSTLNLTDKMHPPRTATPKPTSTAPNSRMSDVARHNSKRFDKVVDIKHSSKSSESSSFSSLLHPIFALFPGTGSATRPLAPAVELKLPVDAPKTIQSMDSSTSESSSAGKPVKSHPLSDVDMDTFVHQPASWSAKRTQPSDAVSAYTHDWRLDVFGDSPVAVKGQRTHYPKPTQPSNPTPATSVPSSLRISPFSRLDSLRYTQSAPVSDPLSRQSARLFAVPPGLDLFARPERPEIKKAALTSASTSSVATSGSGDSHSHSTTSGFTASSKSSKPETEELHTPTSVEFPMPPDSSTAEVVSKKGDRPSSKRAADGNGASGETSPWWRRIGRGGTGSTKPKAVVIPSAAPRPEVPSPTESVEVELKQISLCSSPISESFDSTSSPFAPCVTRLTRSKSDPPAHTPSAFSRMSFASLPSSPFSLSSPFSFIHGGEDAEDAAYTGDTPFTPLTPRSVPSDDDDAEDTDDN